VLHSKVEAERTKNGNESKRLSNDLTTHGGGKESKSLIFKGHERLSNETKGGHSCFPLKITSK